MHRQVVLATSQSIPRKHPRSVNGAQRSPAVAASLGCSANMWVIRRLELVSLSVPFFATRLHCRLYACGSHRLTTSHYHPQSPDGSRVAMSTDAGQIFVFDIASSSIQAAYSSHAMAVRSLAWSADSNVRPFTRSTVLHIV